MALAIHADTLREDSFNRTHSDLNGNDVVHCRVLDDDQLLALAINADQIEIRQPLGGAWVPPRVIDQIIGGLRALPLLTSDQITNAGSTLQRLRLALVDRLARMRVRHGRHVLAGETTREVGGKRLRILVLVFAQCAVMTCDWRLA
jgi:hypothetical protein